MENVTPTIPLTIIATIGIGMESKDVKYNAAQRQTANIEGAIISRRYIRNEDFKA